MCEETYTIYRPGGDPAFVHQPVTRPIVLDHLLSKPSEKLRASGDKCKYCVNYPSCEKEFVNFKNQTSCEWAPSRFQHGGPR